MAEQSEKARKIRAAQIEAATRPVIGGEGEDPRQVKLNSEVISSETRKARARLNKGKINIEEFDTLVGRQ